MSGLWRCLGFRYVLFFFFLSDFIILTNDLDYIYSKFYLWFCQWQGQGGDNESNNGGVRDASALEPQVCSFFIYFSPTNNYLKVLPTYDYTGI